MSKFAADGGAGGGGRGARTPPQSPSRKNPGTYVTLLRGIVMLHCIFKLKNFTKKSIFFHFFGHFDTFIEGNLGCLNNT